jgi:Domain of unknown function (DUF4337)
MSGAHEELERAQHASHGGVHHASNKHIGLTMAIIGALIAFCAAMVGSERNELMRSMVEQTQANADAAGASTKYRLVMMELEKQRGQRAGLATRIDQADPQRDHIVRRFLELARDYTKERAMSKKWADSFQPVIGAHFDAAEHYERAQLIAEIGIVVASLAVLLSNRAAWLLSIALAAACIGQLGWTFAHTRYVVDATVGKVRHAEEAYLDERKQQRGEKDDKTCIEALDPGGKIRAELAPKTTEPEPPH